MLKVSFLLWLGTYAVFSNPIGPQSKIEKNYRLSQDVIPSKYSITISPNFPTESNETTATFIGSVVIEAQVMVSLNKIRLHAAMEIPKEKVIVEVYINYEWNEIPVSNVRTFKEGNLIDIELDTDLNKDDKIKISVKDYVGDMKDDMYGFYLSSYKDKKKETQWIGTTQFQPTHARRAFPCFDEPNFKAIFEVTIKVPRGYTSLSNMKRKMPKNDVLTHVYEPTPRMSTYLVAFVVSKFSPDMGKDNRFNVWARPEAIYDNQTNYAAENGMKFVDALKTFTQLDYFEMSEPKMKKIDMVALPDFAAGAMENWGLLTYRETALLYKDSESTARNKQRVASVIAHELAHQWFGDLVTLDWWDNTWLNEGFATYFEYHITHEVEKDWEMKDQFVIEEQQSVFGLDALQSAKALTNPVNTPAEIQANFGTISYNKGGCIIRMMEYILNTNNFKAGLNKYLVENKHKNTTPKELFNAFNDIKDDLEEIMNNWIEKPGYPVITVSLDKELLTFSQERFLLNKKEKEDENDLWHVPITYATKKDELKNITVQLMLSSNESSISVPIEADFDWIIVNIMSSGYYRVNYELQLLDKIIKILKDKEMRTAIPQLNRAQIIDDTMNLARAGYLKYNKAFEVISYLKEEDNYFPWFSAFQGFRFLMQRYSEDTNVGKYLREYIIDLMSKFKHDNFERADKEKQIDTYNRISALEWACNLDVESCTEKAIALFTKFTTKKVPVPVDVRSIVYCTALRHGNETDWDNLWEKFMESTVAADQITILNALGCTQDEEVLNMFLNKSITDSDIRKQDKMYVFSSVYTGNSKGVDLALNFLTTKGNWKKIRDNYGGMNALGKAITGIADRLTTKEQSEKLATFIKENKDDLEDAAIVAEQAQEAIAENLAWAEKYKDDILNYLKNGSALVNGNIISIVFGLLAVFIARF